MEVSVRDVGSLIFIWTSKVGWMVRPQTRYKVGYVASKVSFDQQ